MKHTIVLLASLLWATCSAQVPQTLHGNLRDARFVGYDNGVPIFYKPTDKYGLYSLVRHGKDSLIFERAREGKLPVWNENVRLIWINNEVEVYTRRLPQPDGNNRDFILAVKDGIDTVPVVLNGFYQSDYEPFAITNDRKTLFAVQPEGYLDEDRSWYYENIMKVDLTKKPLTVEKLPISGIQMQVVGDYLYYKGGSGKLENAILRVKIPQWEQIDTLLYHVGYWFVQNNILYAETGGYSTQDTWIGAHHEQKIVAYSISKQKCAIVSEKTQNFSDRQPFVFQGQLYSLWGAGIMRIDVPTITEFPYKQTFPR